MLSQLAAAVFIGVVAFIAVPAQGGGKGCATLAYHFDATVEGEHKPWMSSNQALGSDLQTFISVVPLAVVGTKKHHPNGGVGSIVTYNIPSVDDPTHGLWDEKYTFHHHDHDDTDDLHDSEKHTLVFGGQYHTEAFHTSSFHTVTSASTQSFAVLGATGKYAKYSGGSVYVTYKEDLTRTVQICAA